MTIELEIGVRIRARRRLLNWSQGKLGRAVGVSEQQIQRYEAGINKITVGRLVGLAGALGIDVMELISGHASSTSANPARQPYRRAEPQPDPEPAALAAQYADCIVALGKIQNAEIRLRLIELVQRIAEQ